MRLLELALLLINLLALGGCVAAPRFQLWTKAAVLTAILVFVFHLIFEGCRWQMAPSYLSTGVLFLASICPSFVKLGFWSSSGIVIGLVLGAVIGTILPVFSFPSPTGPFSIGSMSRHLADASREETLGGPEKQPRELMIQIWYPAEASGKTQYYTPNSRTTLKNAHLRLARVHSLGGAPIAQAINGIPS